MVSRHIVITGLLLISALSQIGCCSCHRRNAFRVQNSCCTPAAKSCGCDPVTSYRRPNGMVDPMTEPPMGAPAGLMQQAR